MEEKHFAVLNASAFFVEKKRAVLCVECQFLQGGIDKAAVVHAQISIEPGLTIKLVVLMTK